MSVPHLLSVAILDLERLPEEQMLEAISYTLARRYLAAAKLSETKRERRLAQIMARISEHTQVANVHAHRAEITLDDSRNRVPAAAVQIIDAVARQDLTGDEMFTAFAQVAALLWQGKRPSEFAGQVRAAGQCMSAQITDAIVAMEMWIE